MTVEAIAIVTASATVVYGVATFLLWWENRQDRKQRDKQFHEETANLKLHELHSAFYDAWGYWRGHDAKSGNSVIDASQAGRVFEALIRLECQLRLNDYKRQAHDLGYAIRTLSGVDEQLAEVGVVLGLFPTEYRRFTAVGFSAS